MVNRATTAHGARACAIGVDIGRTKIAAGVVTGDGQVLDKRVVPAPSHLAYEDVLDEVVGVIKELAGTHPAVSCVGVGTAEVVNWPSGDILLAAGEDTTFPLRKHVQNAIGLPTVVDSDANVAAWGEFRHGAAVGAENTTLITVGTGIGGGVITGGEIYRGSTGFAGEIGHLVVHPFGETCTCGNVGCLEAMASGTALARNASRAVASDSEGLLARLAGAEPITGEMVFAAAQAGDARAVALFDELGCWLGLGIAAMVLLFDPQIVLIGGGLARTGELLLTPATRSARRNTQVLRGHMPSIALSSHDTWSGLIGSATLALDLAAES